MKFEKLRAKAEIYKEKLQRFEERRELYNRLHDLILEYNVKIRDNQARMERAGLAELFDQELRPFPDSYKSLFHGDKRELQIAISKIKQDLEDLAQSEMTMQLGRAQVMKIYQEQKEIFQKVAEAQETKYQKQMAREKPVRPKRRGW